MNIIELDRRIDLTDSPAVLRGQTETNGRPKSRTFFSNPCKADWSITGPVKSVSPLSIQRDGQAPKPVCPLRTQMAFDPDLIDHGLSRVSLGVKFV